MLEADPSPDEDDPDEVEEPPEPPPDEDPPPAPPDGRETAVPVGVPVAGRESGRCSLDCAARAGPTLSENVAAAAHKVAARRVMMFSPELTWGTAPHRLAA
jgi:hypothetical protein